MEQNTVFLHFVARSGLRNKRLYLELTVGVNSLFRKNRSISLCIARTRYRFHTYYVAGIVFFALIGILVNINTLTVCKKTVIFKAAVSFTKICIACTAAFNHKVIYCIIICGCGIRLLHILTQYNTGYCKLL